LNLCLVQLVIVEPDRVAIVMRRENEAVFQLGQKARVNLDGIEIDEVTLQAAVTAVIGMIARHTVETPPGHLPGTSASRTANTSFKTSAPLASTATSHCVPPSAAQFQP
jgi:hypothetical protein